MIPLFQKVALLLCLGGVVIGFFVTVIILARMSSNKSMAYNGDKDASNHLVLPCYRLLFKLLAVVYVLQMVIAAALYGTTFAWNTLSTHNIQACTLFCAIFFQIFCSISPLLLWVTSLSHRGFRKVGNIIFPGFILNLVIFISLFFVDSSRFRIGVLLCLVVFTISPCLALAIGILSKKLVSRLEVRSSSSRSTTEFLLVYSSCTACFGSLYSVDDSSVAGMVGLGAAVLLMGLYPLALYRSCVADTKFWRGLGKHNRGGILGSSAEPSRMDTVTLRVASTHLQTVLSDLSSLMIDFAFIEVGTVIGRGASSCVYKAEYKQSKVAIKVLNPPEITEEELISIREETCINAVLCHPCIVKIIGICVRPPEIGIVMEFCLKGTLKKSLQTNALEWTSLRRLHAMADLANAVAHVHASGFMHRDIKAENLFVTDQWKVKLGDFGESRSILDQNRTEAEKERDSQQWNQRMTVLGTVAYMAPELVNAQPVYTEAIDVYAMGITFWEIWTGKDPFAKENTFSLYQLIAQGSRPEIPSTCPTGFKEVLNDAWHTSATHRPLASVISKRMNEIIECFESSLPSPTADMSCLYISGEESTPLTGVNAKPNVSNKKAKRDASFRFDDMYDECNTSDLDETYTNPLKLLYLKSLKMKT